MTNSRKCTAVSSRGLQHARNGRTKLSPGAIVAFVLVAILAVESVQAQNVPTKASAKKFQEAIPEAARVTHGPQLTLKDFLVQVEQKNGNFRSLQASREAARARRLAGDIELATALTAKYGENDNKRPQVLGTVATITSVEGKEASIGLAKKFSTGTQASVTASATEATTNMSSAQGNGSTSNAYGAMGIQISQSLWKNFFGEATDLRREREALVEKAETGGLDVQQRKVLIEAESAFWDHIYLHEELRQRVDSLDRARGLEAWMKRRVGNGIGDRTDLIGTEALIAGRELQLLKTQDALTASVRKIRELLEMGPNEPFPELTGELGGIRDVNAQVEGEFGSGGNTQIVSFDAYLAVLQAKAKAVGAREVVEAYKPDLVLSGSYSTNSVDTSMSGATNDITNTRIPSTAVGVSFTYLLDPGVKNAQKDVARMEALSAKQIQERKLLDSRAAWEEMVRRHGQITNMVKVADRSSRLQLEKADAEKEKLTKGRSITSTVVQAEQDAAEGRLMLAQMQAEQRKLEAQSRMFIRLSEEK